MGIVPIHGYDADMSRNDLERVPVTLISGWHGAGKTKLVTRLLEREPGALAVASWSASAPPPGAVIAPECTVHLNEGCLCCALRWDLATAARILSSRLPRPPRLLVELGGSTDVALAAQTLLRDARTNRRVRLENLVAVVDASAAAVRIRTGQVPWSPRLLWEQVAMADAVVLSQVHRLTPEACHEVRAAVATHNPLASILMAGPDCTDALAERSADGFGPGGASRIGSLAQTGSHGSTVVVEVPGTLDTGVVGDWLRSLHRRFGPDLLRLRGVLAIAGEPRRRLLCGVRTFVGQWAGAPWGRDAPFTRLVLVGRGLPARELSEELAVARGD